MVDVPCEDHEGKKWDIDLSPLTGSTPDIMLMHSSHSETVPIMFIEVHSKPSKEGYISIIKKVILNTIDLMRWFFNYCDGLTILHGYTLPTSTEDGSNTLGFATKVSITFEADDCQFDVKVEYIKMDSLSSMLSDSVKQNIQGIYRIPKNFDHQHQQFFFKLPEQFLKKNDFILKIPLSIVLGNQVSVFKHINNKYEETTAFNLYVNRENLKLQKSLLPDSCVKIADLNFFKIFISL